MWSKLTTAIGTGHDCLVVDVAGRSAAFESDGPCVVSPTRGPFLLPTILKDER